MQHNKRVRARELGIAPGIYSPGPLNAITDVAGVRVGHTTCIAVSYTHLDVYKRQNSDAVNKTK